MDRRNCAAILLFVLGIVEVYSFAQKHDPTAKAVSRNFSEDNDHHDASLQVSTFEHERLGRIRRDQRDGSSDRGKKAARVAELSQRIITDERIQRENERRRSERLRVDQQLFATILTNYMRDGLTPLESTARMRQEHPGLANQFLPANTRPRL